MQSNQDLHRLTRLQNINLVSLLFASFNIWRKHARIRSVSLKCIWIPLTSTKQIVGVCYGGALDTFCFPNIGGGGGAVRGGYFKLVFLECSVYV